MTISATAVTNLILAAHHYDDDATYVIMHRDDQRTEILHISQSYVVSVTHGLTILRLSEEDDRQARQALNLHEFLKYIRAARMFRHVP